MLKKCAISKTANNQYNNTQDLIVMDDNMIIFRKAFVVVTLITCSLYIRLYAVSWTTSLITLYAQKGCTSNIDSSLPMIYASPNGSCVLGKPFNVSTNQLEQLGLPPSHFFELDNNTVRDFIFVTACDYTHFEESVAAIYYVQEMFPGYQLHYYDLGLNEDQIQKIATWCNVVYHKFEFGRYPEHISKIRHKCFKSLVIQDALKEHGAVFWMDASVRIKKPIDEWQTIFNKAISTKGMVLPWRLRYSNFGFTDPIMYEYWPTDVDKQKTLLQASSCMMLIYNTEFIQKHILHWMYLCSLDEMCCLPHGEDLEKNLSDFSVSDKRNNSVYKVKRYDQAMSNLLLSNLFGYNGSAYYHDQRKAGRSEYFDCRGGEIPDIQAKTCSA